MQLEKQRDLKSSILVPNDKIKVNDQGRCVLNDVVSYL